MVIVIMEIVVLWGTYLAEHTRQSAASPPRIFMASVNEWRDWTKETWHEP